jgi:hypothetical protein
MPQRDKTNQLPIYQKAEQIFKLTEGFIQIIPKEDCFFARKYHYIYDERCYDHPCQDYRC